MKLKIECMLIILGAVLCKSSQANPLSELEENEIHARVVRQTGIDSCVIGCIVNAVTNVGMTSLRPSSWSWNFSDLLQSAVLRTYCQAYNQTTICISNCAFSPAKLLIGAVMGLPGTLCTGSANAKACLHNVSKTMQSTCDNRCIELKPSFGMSTWMSMTKMSNIFNDMCAYWGCQLACGKPAVERQCGQESVSLYNRITSIGLDTLKDALKSAGLSSVCGGNVTRVPNTYEIRTDSPIDNGGGGERPGGRERPGGHGDRTEGGGGSDYGDDNRPPTDSEEGNNDNEGGRGGNRGRGQGGRDGDGEETGISLGGQRRGGVSTGNPLRNTVTTSPISGRRGNGSRGGGGRGGQGGQRQRTTTPLPEAEDGSRLGDDDYWQSVSTGRRRGQNGQVGQGGRGGFNDGQGGQGGRGGFDDGQGGQGGRGNQDGNGGRNQDRQDSTNQRRDQSDDDDIPPPRNTGVSNFGEDSGLGDLNLKRRPIRVTTPQYGRRGLQTQHEQNSRRNNDLPSMRVGNSDRQTGEVNLKLDN